MAVDARRVVLALAPTVLIVLLGAVSRSQDTPAVQRARRQSKRSGRGVSKSEKGKARAARRLRVQALASHLENVLQWPGLADFLDMVAHGESRWTFTANKSKLGTNAALGLFQIRPTSAFPNREFKWRIPATPSRFTGKAARKFRRRQRAKRAIQHSAALMDPCVNIAAAVSFLARMANKRGHHATWEQARAAFAYPIFIRGRPTFLPKSERIRKRYPTLAAWQGRYDAAVSRAHKSTAAIGLPQSFLKEPAFPPGFGGVWKTNGKSVRTAMALLGCPHMLAGLVND